MKWTAEKGREVSAVKSGRSGKGGAPLSVVQRKDVEAVNGSPAWRQQCRLGS